jgi:predicted XRE-type DNA-binding protein
MGEVDPIPALKRQAAAEIVILLGTWNADDIASVLRTDQPRISDLRRGKLDRFSLETLIRYLVRLRRDVALTISPRASFKPTQRH